MILLPRKHFATCLEFQVFPHHYTFWTEWFYMIYLFVCDCKGKIFDNVLSMSGNSAACYVPSPGHSRDLVGVKAV
jgi:hypothetical protein